MTITVLGEALWDVYALHEGEDLRTRRVEQRFLGTLRKFDLMLDVIYQYRWIFE